MRDMEIRGVGNLLGVEQSGQMEAIGFDLYMEMLQECLAEIQGQDIPAVDDTQIDLPLTAFIPADWIPENEEKMAAYRAADPATQVGPLTSARQRERVEGYIAAGRDQGATVAVGGGRPAGFDRGWYVEPTVFADVDNGMRIAQEEIFGPVLAVIGYDDVDDAVAIANDSEYGLSGSVWSADVERATAIANRMQTGTVSVNGFMIEFCAPFGGFKNSGLGRELGPEGLAHYLEYKTVMYPSGGM
jgi:betaine-aldehyde dehydrogenase